MTIRALGFLAPVGLVAALALASVGGASAKERETGRGSNPAPRVELVSLDLESANLLDVLRYFSEVSRLNLVVYPGVSGSVTVRLVDVPWDQALTLILRVHGLAMAVGSNVLEIAPAEELLRRGREQVALAAAKDKGAPLVTHIIRVSYGDAAAIAAAIGKAALSPRGSVVVDARTQSLIVADVASRFGRVRGLVQSLDR